MKNSFTFFKIFFNTLFFLVLTSFSCLATEGSKKTTSPTPYPLSTCVVSENPLGVMGPPFIIQHDGTEVRFCCEECVKDFNKDPEKYLKRLHGESQ
ncbi:MAG: hypothetical protein K9M81_00190 [Chthoniobacterales bacterium]|nr:hypothetical protein [Chthoniobacterales bacterium]